MTDLIAKLEQATEGSWELDRDIAAVVGDDSIFVRKPSQSFDGAVTLLPAGWEWLVSNRAEAPHAYIHNKEPIWCIDGGLTRNPKYRGFECTAATPVLALCIAALKARSRP